MNIQNLLKFLALVAALIFFYSILFHYIMAWEGRTEYSWITGFYWTMTVMSTLGFGDITFESDLGRLFSTVVLLSGMVLLLILLPFTFIEFFYDPWVKAQAAARAPSELPAVTRDHVILTEHDVVTDALIEKLTHYNYSYVVLVSDLTEALRLHDLGYRVMLGDLDNPETYKRCRVDQAALVATTSSDMVNTNVAFTVREISESVPIVATANKQASVDILELAGSNDVLQLGEMLGQALARRVTGGNTLAHVIGQFDQLLIAEAPIASTSLVGKVIRDSNLREEVGAIVVGVWERGEFQVAGPDTPLSAETVLVLAGSEEQIKRYNDLYHHRTVASEPIIIIGGGRVGRATGKALAQRGLDYRIVERTPDRIRNAEKYILGDAAELEVLEQAGIHNTSTIVVTTHTDDMNIYLTIYCRRLRPDAQIISRATLERNVATLHRAGADFVMSYASMGANTILNLLGRSNIVMFTEGLDLFKVQMPTALVGKNLINAHIRETTGAMVVAIKTLAGVEINPDPTEPLPADAQLILIGTEAAERRFLLQYSGKKVGRIPNFVHQVTS